MKVHVAGAGWVNGRGPGSGRTDLVSWPPSGPVAISRRQVFQTARPHFGRMDLYSKMGVSAIAFALRDAGLETKTRSSLIGILASTTHGCLHTDIAYARTIETQPDPRLFAYTLPNTFLGEAAVEFGITGPTILFGEPVLDGRVALLTALDIINTGEAHVVVAGIIDQGGVGSRRRESAFVGALFLVLTSHTADPSYGYVEHSADAGFSFAGQPVSHIGDVARLLPEKV